MQNGAFGQQLISEWTGKLYDGTKTNLDEVTRASGKRVKWRCDKGMNGMLQYIVERDKSVVVLIVLDGWLQKKTV